MSYTTSRTPRKNEIHHVVIHVDGQKAKNFKEFKAALKKLVNSHGGRIGARGRIEKGTGQFKKG